MTEFPGALAAMPLIAILRGVRPEEVLAIAEVLVGAGIVAIEVPLNSPDPHESIGRLAERFGGRALIGAGTVMTTVEISKVRAAGGRLIVMPHSDPALIGETKRLGLISMPGVATPSEAFAALAAGADALKLFPGEALGPAVVKAWRAVLPSELWLLPVGGIEPESLGPYLAAGANGFGIGSALYKAGREVSDIEKRARHFVAAHRGRA